MRILSAIRPKRFFIGEDSGPIPPLFAGYLPLPMMTGGLKVGSSISTQVEVPEPDLKNSTYP
jgi:hypothetical protein